jgi:hypothetical protein
MSTSDAKSQHIPPDETVTAFYDDDPFPGEDGNPKESGTLDADELLRLKQSLDDTDEEITGLEYAIRPVVNLYREKLEVRNNLARQFMEAANALKDSAGPGDVVLVDDRGQTELFPVVDAWRDCIAVNFGGCVQTLFRETLTWGNMLRCNFLNARDIPGAVEKDEDSEVPF